MISSVLMLLLAGQIGQPLSAGDGTRHVLVDGKPRSYLVHVPPQYDATQPTPVVLVLHGLGINAAIMVPFSGMNDKSDEAGFIAVYPNGSGIGPFRTFNAGGRSGPMAHRAADDVQFVSLLLDDLSGVANVDAKRVFATGISNGGMLCYRLAAELSERIAAIAPVAGAMAIEQAHPSRPVSVLHFHGTADKIVPYTGPNRTTPPFLTFLSVEESIAVWRRINECPEVPTLTQWNDSHPDGTSVEQLVYGPGREGTEVILVKICGGGHTWPGKDSLVGRLGRSSLEISANDLIWEFFQKHPIP